MTKFEELSDESLESSIQYAEMWLARDPADFFEFLRSFPDRKVWRQKVEVAFLAAGPQDSNEARKDAYNAAINQVDEEYLAKFMSEFEAMKNETVRRAAVFDSIKPVCPRSSWQDDDDDDDDDAMVN